MAGRRAISSPILLLGAACLRAGRALLRSRVAARSSRDGSEWRIWAVRCGARTPMIAWVRCRPRSSMTLRLTTPYLIEATGDADVEVRIAACRFWHRGRITGRWLISVLSTAAGTPARDSRRRGTDPGPDSGRKHGTSQAKHSPSAPAAFSGRGNGDPLPVAQGPAERGEGRGGRALGEGPGPAPAELVAAADDTDRGVRLAVAKSSAATGTDPTTPRRPGSSALWSPTRDRSLIAS